MSQNEMFDKAENKAAKNKHKTSSTTDSKAIPPVARETPYRNVSPLRINYHDVKTCSGERPNTRSPIGMPRKSTVSDKEAAASIRKILGTEGLENIPQSGSPLWEKISRDLQGKWKACTIYSYVSRNYHQILTLARAGSEPEKSQATLAIKQEPDFDESSSENEEVSPPPRRILTKEERSILVEYEKFEQEEAKMLLLFAVSYFRSPLICPLSKMVQKTDSQFELCCVNSGFRLPIAVDLKNFRKFLQAGKNCPYSSLCCGLRSSMVLSYKNEFRLHVLCQQCLEVTVYRLPRSSRGKFL